MRCPPWPGQLGPQQEGAPGKLKNENDPLRTLPETPCASWPPAPVRQCVSPSQRFLVTRLSRSNQSHSRRSQDPHVPRDILPGVNSSLSATKPWLTQNPHCQLQHGDTTQSLAQTGWRLPAEGDRVPPCNSWQASAWTHVLTDPAPDGLDPGIDFLRLRSLSNRHTP